MRSLLINDFRTVAAVYDRRQCRSFNAFGGHRPPLQCALISRIVLWAVVVLACSPLLAAQNRPDLSGMWIVQDPGSGNWAEWFNNVPKPALRQEIIKDNEAIAAREAAGGVVNRAERLASCPFGNLPMMMASSPPLNIVQSEEEILIGAEANRGRFIYMDGRDHPDIKSPYYVPSGFGHSIGHWEGDTLVVGTVGFPPRVCDSRRPVMLTPGGGRAKETTRLVERFRLIEGGETLSVTFTWEDPTVLMAPHTYSYKYKKLVGTQPIENNDDPTDPAYQQRLLESVIPPPQK
jgi:hypothetical protein